MLLIRQGVDPERFVARTGRVWEHMAARLLAPTLDRQLAAGRSPEDNGLLALRALTLVAPARRRALARNWEHLLEVVRPQPSPPSPRVALCRDRITAAEPAVRQMLVALVAPLPVPARGVAGARLLLGDGAGPLYNRHCSTDLVAALRELWQELDPASGLMIRCGAPPTGTGPPG